MKIATQKKFKKNNLSNCKYVLKITHKIINKVKKLKRKATI